MSLTSTRESVVMVFAAVFSLVFLQGCATPRDKPYVHTAETTLLPGEAIRYKTPEFIKSTPGVSALGALVGVPLSGGLGAARTARAIALIEGKRLSEKAQIPDFGELVTRKFVARARAEIPNWPELTIRDEPVEGPDAHASGTLLEFKVNEIGLSSYPADKGFVASVTVKMALRNKVLWRRTFAYESKKYGRERALEEFEADGGKLLRAEMEFAAETAVTDFITHFGASLEKGDT